MDELPRPRASARRSRDSGISVAFSILFTVLLGAFAVLAQWLINESRPSVEEMSHYYFRNCEEARAADAAPLLIGEPWYRPQLDGDEDGVACEWQAPSTTRQIMKGARNVLARWLGRGEMVDATGIEPVTPSV